MNKISCVYFIRNIVNNQIYIGSTQDFNRRKSTHLRMLRNGNHHSVYLQRAFNKYGEDKFVFEIIQLTDSNGNSIIENEYINKHNPTYNMSLDTVAFMKNRKHSQKTRKLMSKRKRGNKNSLGFKHNVESRKKRSEFTKGRRHTDITKNKMKEKALQNNSVKYLKYFKESTKKQVLDSQGNLFSSLAEAAIFWKISVATVCDILKGRHSKTRKGVSFEYKL